MCEFSPDNGVYLELPRLAYCYASQAVAKSNSNGPVLMCIYLVSLCILSLNSLYFSSSISLMHICSSVPVKAFLQAVGIELISRPSHD